MNLLSFEYFAAIIKYGSISKAANHLYVSQQSLSERMARLEKEIGTTLLARGRPISMTPAGKRFLDCAERILRERDSMLSDVQEIIKSRKYSISFGVATHETPPFLPNFLIKFSEAYPEYNIVVHSVKDINWSDLSNLDIDFIIKDVDFGDAGQQYDGCWNAECLYHDNRYAVIAKISLLLQSFGDRWPSIESRLLAEKDLRILQELPFLSVRNKGSQYYHFLQKVFDCAGFDPVVSFQADMNSLNNEMCMKGVAAFLGPEGLCRQKLEVFLKEADDMRLYPVEVPGIDHGLSIFYKKDMALGEVHRGFIEMCREFVVA